MRVLKWVGYAVFALIIASIPAYWWLFSENHAPSTTDYSIDIGKVRQLADSVSGDKPTLIKVETVGRASYLRALVVAGEDWRATDMPVSAYELVYPARSAIIDTTFSAGVAKDIGFDEFDPAAFARVSAALAKASLIVITHEHADHVGGLLAQPNPKALLGVTRLTGEQVAELRKSLGADPLAKLRLNADTLFRGYRPLAFDRYEAVAPGVVLIKAPGHTPGSQMVYVKRTDGAEFLFLGDVAWQMANIDSMRERARLVTWLANEDRQAVLNELVELNRLHRAQPGLHMMPGHDPAAIDQFLKAGLLTKGF